MTNKESSGTPINNLDKHVPNRFTKYFTPQAPALATIHKWGADGIEQSLPTLGLRLIKSLVAEWPAQYAAFFDNYVIQWMPRTLGDRVRKSIEKQLADPEGYFREFQNPLGKWRTLESHWLFDDQVDAYLAAWRKGISIAEERGGVQAFNILSTAYMQFMIEHSTMDQITGAVALREMSPLIVEGTYPTSEDLEFEIEAWAAAPTVLTCFRRYFPHVRETNYLPYNLWLKWRTTWENDKWTEFVVNAEPLWNDDCMLMVPQYIRKWLDGKN